VESHSADQECCQCTPLSPALIQEKAVGLYESVKEEIAIIVEKKKDSRMLVKMKK
jgi:hypothetical protein